MVDVYNKKEEAKREREINTGNSLVKGNLWFISSYKAKRDRAGLKESLVKHFTRK
jgi:hypothetical protein